MRNEVILVGRVAYKYKMSKTVNGGKYIWFPLEIENKDGATSTENNYHQNVNVMCYKPNIIKRLVDLKLKPGNIVVVFGFVSSFRQEIKGKDYVLNAINANEVYIVKTSTKENNGELQTGD